MLSTEQKITALQQAVQTSPEYADIVPLFIGSDEFIRGREKNTGITIVPLQADPKKTNGESFPLVNCSDLSVDKEQAVAFLLGIIEVLSRKGLENDEYLQKIGAALRNGAVEPVTVYHAILGRDRAPVNDLSTTLAVPSPLVEYIFEIPLKTALKIFLLSLVRKLSLGGRKVFARSALLGQAWLNYEEKRGNASFPARPARSVGRLNGWPVLTAAVTIRKNYPILLPEKAQFGLTPARRAVAILKHVIHVKAAVMCLWRLKIC